MEKEKSKSVKKKILENKDRILEEVAKKLEKLHTDTDNKLKQICEDCNRKY